MIRKAARFHGDAACKELDIGRVGAPRFFAGSNCVPCKAAGTDGKVLGECNESFGFGQKNLPQLQDHPPQGCGARDLHGSASQAAPRLIGKY